MKYSIRPDPSCKACHGEGTVYDTVDYGSTTAQLPSWCECVERQIPETFDDRTDEIVIIPLEQTAEIENDPVNDRMKQLNRLARAAIAKATWEQL